MAGCGYVLVTWGCVLWIPVNYDVDMSSGGEGQAWTRMLTGVHIA